MTSGKISYAKALLRHQTSIILNRRILYGGDLASTGTVKPLLRAQVLSPDKTLGKKPQLPTLNWHSQRNS